MGGRNWPDEALNDEITIEEIGKTIKKMKNEKASGPDGFTYEMLKNNIQEVTLVLATLFNSIQNATKKPIPWNQSWIVPVYKNGNRDCLSSYRCINLASCIEKLLTKVLNNRLTRWIESHGIVNAEQTGFRKGNSVIDNILLLKEVIQIYKNTKTPLYIAFVDLSKAFDTIPINRLKKKLSAILPQSKLLSLVIKLLNNKAYKVLLNGEETETFRLMNGIPQGDSLSPTLFCIYINDFLNVLKRNHDYVDPVVIDDLEISSVIYADDILLMSQSQEGIKKQIKFCKITV